AFGEPRAKRQQSDRIALCQDTAFADFKRYTGLGHYNANAIPAWVAHGARAVINPHRSGHHVHKLGLVGSSHKHKAGQTTEISEDEGTSVRRPIGADESSAVHHKTDRKLLNGHVVHNLVVGPLQEGRIDRNEWLVPLRREARREGDSVLLGNSDIEGSLRKRLGENVNASTAR